VITTHKKILQIRTFYEQHKQKLVVYAGSITGNMADAEDVIQSAFVNVLHKIQRDGFFPNDLKAFIYRAVHNTAIDKLRTAKNTVPLEHFSIANPSSDNAETRLVYQDLNEELAKLEKTIREILMLKIYSGLTFKEISDVIKIPAFTVATKYYRAIRILKKTMTRKAQHIS
jgi:RNA polymerase sigma-70 factor, ECF subfamily